MTLHSKTKRRWLVLGSQSQIGAALIPYLRSRGEEVLSTSRNGAAGDTSFDVLKDEVSEISKLSGDVSVVCLGKTSLRQCEEDPEGTYAINVLGTEQLCRSLAQEGSRVIVFSSDAALESGKVDGPNTQRDPKSLTRYGRQKVALENAVQDVEGVNVIRLGKVVSASEEPWNAWLNQLRGGVSITAFRDYLFRPIHMNDVLSAIRVISEQGKSGLWEVGGKDEVSYFDFMMAVSAALMSGSQVHPTSGAGVVRVGESKLLDCGRLEASGKWKAPEFSKVVRDLLDDFRSLDFEREKR